MCISTPKCSMAEAVTGVPRSPALSLSLFSAQGFGNVAICQTANCFCAISKCTFYVLFWSFSVFFFSFRLKGCSPPPLLVGTRSPCHACTYRHTAIFFPVQAALLSAQPCLQNPCFLVSRLLYRVCNLCSCLSGHLHLAYNKV